MVETESIEIPSHEVVSKASKQNSPHIVISEQPASKVNRFRYLSEHRPPIRIPGKRSTTYPQIQIVGHTGNEDILIVVSCVTEKEWLAHPHHLVGRHCKEGIYKRRLDKKTKTVTFNDLSIQSVKRVEFQESLKLRKKKLVNPFKKGFDHVTDPEFRFNHHTVRLAFQAFILLEGDLRKELQAKVSEPISDTKAFTSLKISRLCNASAPAEGGTEIILLCENILEGGVEVLFWERISNQYAFGVVCFNHKKSAIVVKTPPYHDLNIDKKVQVEIRLIRPSDGEFGEPVIFAYTPTKEPERRRKLPRRFDFSENMLVVQSEGRPSPVPGSSTSTNRNESFNEIHSGTENYNSSASDFIKDVDSEDLMKFGADFPNIDGPSDSEQICQILAEWFQ